MTHTAEARSREGEPPLQLPRGAGGEGVEAVTGSERVRRAGHRYHRETRPWRGWGVGARLAHAQRFAHPRGNRGAVVAVQVHPGSSRLIEAWHSERFVEPEITQRLPATEIEFAGNLLLRHGQEAGIG